VSQRTARREPLHQRDKSGQILPMLCRLYMDQELPVGESIALPQDQAHYLRNVMRLEAGDTLLLFNGRGGEYPSHIEQLNRQHVCCRVESFSDVSREMSCRVHIVQAACRSEKIETVLQKGTELGAASFHIVRSERSTLKLDSAKLQKRILRWQKIIMEAAEQSGRTLLPTVHWHAHLAEAPRQGLCFTLHPETATSWHAQRQTLSQTAEITLAIGPEGGWSKHDIDQLSECGYQAITFGDRIMRTETAAPALLAAIQAVSAGELSA